MDHYHKFSSNIFMGFYFEVCRENVLSLHPIIFEKESLTLCSKSFHPKYLWFLFLKVVRKGFLSKKRGFEEHYYQILLKCFSLHLVIFEKGSVKPCSKSFPSYHPKYLWFFIFESREKWFFFSKQQF